MPAAVRQRVASQAAVLPAAETTRSALIRSPPRYLARRRRFELTTVRSARQGGGNRRWPTVGSRSGGVGIQELGGLEGLARAGTVAGAGTAGRETGRPGRD